MANHLDVADLMAENARLREALQFIADGYDNHDVNHVDYRVKVYQVATETLETLVSPALRNPEGDR
jgi:hypothetical protein